MVVTTQFDVPEVLSVYEHHDNYEIYDELNKESDVCIIYFSSHGIYYPNDSETFVKRIVDGNRFEWRRNFLTSARKIILVRDVLKTWYLKGINGEINTVEKILEFLSAESEGLRVVCVGNSAGGYAATLFGSLLKADHVFNFSGQFSLLPFLSDEKSRMKNPMLSRNQSNATISRYYHLEDVIKASNVPVFYFYPSEVESDVAQASEVDCLKQMYSFPIVSRVHGRTCHVINFIDLFEMSTEELIRLNGKYSKKPISPFLFSVSVSGLVKTSLYVLKKFPINLIDKIYRAIPPSMQTFSKTLVQR